MYVQWSLRRALTPDKRLAASAVRRLFLEGGT
jgi:hypothetical protein